MGGKRLWGFAAEWNRWRAEQLDAPPHTSASQSCKQCWLELQTYQTPPHHPYHTHGAASSRRLISDGTHQRASAAGVGDRDGAPLAQQADQLIINAQLRAADGCARCATHTVGQLQVGPYRAVLLLSLAGQLAAEAPRQTPCELLCPGRCRARHRAHSSKDTPRACPLDASGTALPHACLRLAPTVCIHASMPLPSADLLVR